MKTMAAALPTDKPAGPTVPAASPAAYAANRGPGPLWSEAAPTPRPNINRPAFPAPVLCIDNFLSQEDAGLVLQECIDLRKLYVPAEVMATPDAGKVNPAIRKNDVVYLDHAFKLAPERSKILTILKQNIWSDEYRKLWHEGYHIFDSVNYSTFQQAVLSRYGTCNFYRKHRDTLARNPANRLVTLVYYVNTIPERFTGGTLTLWDGKESLKIEPKHNRAVAFPSFTIHEVENVTLNSDKWEDGRFSINYWLGFA